jgi:hypothetical protein
MEEPEDAEIEALVAAFVAQRDSGAPESAAAFASKQPGRVRAGLLRALRALASAEDLLPGVTLEAPRAVGRSGGSACSASSGAAAWDASTGRSTATARKSRSS